MSRTPTDRIQTIQSPVIPIVGEWIAAHPGTISLGQGVVHYSAPESVGNTVAESVKNDPSIDRYNNVRGIEMLIDRIGRKVQTENRLPLDRSSIVITPGSNTGFLNAVFAIADVDDEIILLSPFYFNHEMAIDLAGCKPVHVPTDENYQIDLAAIENAITPKTRAVVTVSPNNPTGAVYSEASLTAVNQLCKKHDIYHISDEAYEYFIYDGKHFSAGSLSDASDHTISLYTLSKAYGMAGWRMGYMVLPSHLETAVKKIQDTNLVCPPILNQVAAAAAMDAGAEWCGKQIAGFKDVRDLVLEQLSSLGDRCRVPRPDGAFYVLAQVQSEREDMDLVQTLIRDYGIAVMPGSTFGVKSGCSLRIAYGALDSKTVAEGMGRLVTGLGKLLQKQG